jgi:hypothetical protein
MTKARASQRAKGNALKKAKRKAVSKTEAAPAPRPGTFDAGVHAQKRPGGVGRGKVFGGAKRGSARSS